MIEFLEAVAEVFAGETFGEFGEGVFAGEMPDSPDRCLAIIPQSGASQPPLRSRRFDIFFREVDRQSAAEAATQIHETLVGENVQGKFNVIPGFTGRVTADAEPGIAGIDTQNRVVYQLQYTLLSS